VPDPALIEAGSKSGRVSKVAAGGKVWVAVGRRVMEAAASSSRGVLDGEWTLDPPAVGAGDVGGKYLGCQGGKRW